MQAVRAVGSDSIEGELQRLARSHDALSAAGLALPRLRRLAQRRTGGQGVDEVHEVIRSAVERLPRHQREAAATLFLDGPRRWECNLGERRRAAATILGMSAETFRKKRGGTSPYDALTRRVARELVGMRPAPIPFRAAAVRVGPWALVFVVAGAAISGRWRQRRVGVASVGRSDAGPS